MTKVALTEKEIKKLACPEGKSQALLWDVSLKGFGVRCTANGVKSFIVQRTVDGVEQRRTIGRLGEWTLTEAWEEAGKVLRGMRDGIDPTVAKKEAERKRKTQGLTLREVADDYCQHKKLAARTVLDIQNHLRRNFSDWADEPVVNVTEQKCIKRFDEFNARAPSQCEQAFSILRALLSRARVKLRSTGIDALALNPVDLMYELREKHKDEARDTRIPLDHIGASFNLLRSRADPERNVASDCTAADLTTFLLLTGCRLGEAQTLTFAQLALDADVPTFHLPETKTRPITLPLCTQLVSMLRARAALPRQRGNDYVFPSRTKGTRYMRDVRGTCVLLSKLCDEHVHAHALRRTFDDLATAVGIDSDARRVLLNHAPVDVHARNYGNNRDPKVLLPLVQRVGDWVEAQGIKAAGANVVPMRA